MRRYGKYFWRTVPFVRLLLPLIAGILIEQYAELSLQTLFIAAVISAICIFLFRFFSAAKKYRARWVIGLLFNLLMVCIGSALVYCQNMKYDPGWIGDHLHTRQPVIVTLQESLTEKTNSYKAIANAEAVLARNQWTPIKGKLLLYFKKDSLPGGLQHGSQLIIQKKPQAITNAGNPGSFDYKQYCVFQGIHYQIYLQPKDYQLTGQTHVNHFEAWLIRSRNNVLSILRKYIPGEKEAGVAEALLIGYRDDLDKDLVRSYSNTGVVHIIAISGLHLGMIYGLLLWMLKPFRKIKGMHFLKPLIILTVLWIFTLLAGAAASILRAAVMFSFIVIGESLARRTHMYNTLAASAFCLLVYNPYFLWDTGFQLSYTAVLSIVLFMKPIYKWFYFTNKVLNGIWQLNAISLSSQVLTLPIILYYFHQFPNLFLFTNFIAVPLSGFILYGELLLLSICTIPILNSYIGKIISLLITQMNGFIERTDRLPYAVTGNIQFGLFQTFLLYLVIALFAWWLLQKKKQGLLTGLGLLSVFIFIGQLQKIRHSQQSKLIVYNIPQHSGIDILEGTQHVFLGDSGLIQKASLQNFHLQPSRILHGIGQADSLQNTLINNHLVATSRKTVLIIDRSVSITPLPQKIPVDIIIFRGNPKIYLSQVAAVFDCKLYVFDSSNPLWKIQYWKKDADSLHLRHHSTSEQGAFEMAL